MSANVSLPIKDLEESEILDSESITDSEKDDCSPEGSIVGERLRGDGQEQDVTINKKIDDDEDRRNPQYIPKRGNFYEHDDRTLEEDENSEDENSDGNEGSTKVEKDTPRSRKKVWEEKDGEKWGHDLYIEKEQQPKTKQELINAYGYDIRNEDGPPRARRRRRYGRGPNKYTRNWEDEEAYNRSTQVRARKNPKNPPTAEDFPPLNPVDKQSRSISPNKQRNHSEQSKSDGSGDAGPNRKVRGPRPNKDWKKPKNFDEKKLLTLETNVPYQKDKSNKIQKSSRNNKNEEVYSKEISSKLQQVSKSSKGSPGRGSNQASVPKLNKNRQEEQVQTKIVPITSQSYSNSNRNKQSTSTMTENTPKNDTYEVTRDLNNLSLDHQTIENSSNSSNISSQQISNNLSRQSSVPPRLQQQNEQQQRMGPKRYSSLRQRSLPETTPQTFPQSHQINSTGYYTQDFTAGNPQQGGDTSHSIHPQMQMSPNPNQPSLMINQMPPQQIMTTSTQNPSAASMMGIPMPHTNSQVRAAHMNSAAAQPQSVGNAPHHQLLNAQSAMMAAAAAHTQVSHQQMLNAQPIITHALPQPTPHQPILTQAQGLSPQTQAMLNAQSQQILTAQTHPQYGAPQYQVPNAGNASGVYNIQQAVNAGTTAYIPPQPNAVINSVYGQAPPGAQPPPYTPAPYPTYQPAYTAPPNQPPQDLYQTQGGITYYSPHNQPAAPKAPLKRPKAAIPILAPPERVNSTAPRGRGRSSPTENNTGTVTPPRGRGHASPSENDNFVSRGRGRKMSNENNTLDSSEQTSTSPENIENIGGGTRQEHVETITGESIDGKNLETNTITKSEIYSDVVENAENVENVAQNGTDLNKSSN